MFTHNLTDEYGNLLYGNKVIEADTTQKAESYSFIDGAITEILRFETNNWYKVDEYSTSVNIHPNQNVSDKIIIAHLMFTPAVEIFTPQNFITNGFETASAVEWPYGEPTEYKVGFTYIFRVEQYSPEKMLAYLENIHVTA